MYKLYWCRDTGAFAPQAIFEEAGIAYETVPIDTSKGEQHQAAYLAVNPRGQVPALALPDGTVMTESAAMVLHLVDAHPAAGLAPAPGSPARAVFDRWLLYMAVDVYSADLHVYYPERFTDDPAGAEAVKRAGLAAMDRGLTILEDRLGESGGPFLMGESFSALDPYLAMLIQWHPAPAEVCARHPAIGRLCEQVRSRPAIAPVWDQHFG